MAIHPLSLSSPDDEYKVTHINKTHYTVHEKKIEKYYLKKMIIKMKFKNSKKQNTQNLQK